jgi:predicted ATPase
MKHPDDPSEDDLNDMEEDSIGFENLSPELLKRRLDRLQRERRALSDKLQELDSPAEVYESLTEHLEEMSKQYRETEARLAQLQKRQTGITRITVENFKGISKRVTIPLRPITLLFGANSAGKSTILHAFHFVRELLERNNANPDRTLQGGEAIEMGGFRNLVHKHDLNREIRVRIEITPTDDGVPTLAELLDLDEEDGGSEVFSRLNINSQVQTVALEVVARWDFGRDEGVFSECGYFLNDEAVVTIRKPKPDSLPVIEEINYFHPALLALDESLGELKKEFDREMRRFRSELLTELVGSLLKLSGNAPAQFGFDVVHPKTGAVIAKRGDAIDRNTICRLLANLPNVRCAANADELVPPGRLEIEGAVKRFEEKEHAALKSCGVFPLIQLSGQASPSPSLLQPLPFPPSALGDEGQPYWAVINQVVVGITALVRQRLDSFRYIGPIRAIPDRYHECPQVEEASRWATGLGAWDLLLRHYDRAKGKGDSFVEEVSKWFEDKERLGLGYRIEVAGLRSVAEDSLLMNHLKLLQTQYDERNQHDFRENVLNPLQSTPQRPRIRITDTRTRTEVGPKDIGIGVAQALPIVVGALDSRSPFLAVEQPELHLHPAAQAKLGDLFVTQSKQERFFLIETHSETLMLRIFRRIRETTRKKLPQMELEFTKEDVALLFVAAGESGTQIKPIGLDDQGKFVDPVPGGFFEEGFSELF